MHYPIKTISSFSYSHADYLSIGPTPASEPCLQVGEDTRLRIAECEIYIQQLLRQHGKPPGSCFFFILKNFHEFGTYYEAAISFDPNDEKEVEYACQTESGDDYWDAVAQQQIVDQGITAGKNA